MAERDQTLGSSTPEMAASSSKAGLHFPVDIIRRNLYEGEYAKQFTKNAPIHVAAVLEYVAAEVLELAGNAARDDNRSSIRPIHIERAVVNDEELSKLLGELMSEWRLIIEEESELRLIERLGDLTVSDGDS